VLALLGNFDLTELIVIGVGALLVFGRRLPEVAMKAAAQVMRFRRAVSQMWREAGIEDELRRVKREIEVDVSSGPSRSAALQVKARQDELRGQAASVERAQPSEPTKPISPADEQ
jgi:Sec-independent protein translocase protein TatA